MIRSTHVDRVVEFHGFAQKQELEAARYFYFEAHRFAAWLAAVSDLETVQASAIIAALSPRATWEGNQMDAVAIAMGADASSFMGASGYDARDVALAQEAFNRDREDEDHISLEQAEEMLGSPKNGFRTGGGAGWQAMPRDVDRAVRIASGEPWQEVLVGPKINAFHENIMAPDQADVGIPIDRHLGRAMLGRKLTDHDLTRRISAPGFYGYAEDVYRAAGKRLKLRPIEVGNAIWYVMRRLSSDRGQHSLWMDQPWRPFPGATYRLTRRMPELNLLPGCDWRPWLWEVPLGPCYGNETRCGTKGRVRVNLGPGHRFSNSAGWQWRYRLMVAYALGKLPQGGRLKGNADEQADVDHVHHLNGVKDDDRLRNLEVLSASIHGQTEAHGLTVAGYRDDKGRFMERSNPGPQFKLARVGPVVSTRDIGMDMEPEGKLLENL